MERPVFKLIVLFLLLAFHLSAHERLPLVLRTATIDSILLDGISQKAFPGCQVVILKEGKVVYNRCFGTLNYDTLQKVQPTTLYDLASLSKTTGTLLAIMKLYDNGKIKLNDKASAFLTFLRGTDKENIRIKDLLLHETGLPGSMEFYRTIVEKRTSPSFYPPINSAHSVPMGNPNYSYKHGWTSKIQTAEFITQVADSFYINNTFHNKAMEKIAQTKLGAKSFLYSCVNFMLLKEIVENISGMSLDVFLDQEFFQPMQLSRISYIPLRRFAKEDIAPTLQKDFLRKGVLQGYVHDPDAALLGGISGNAGMFATAHDVAMVHQMLLNNGELNGKRYLCAETCQLFANTTSSSGRRGLGFDKPNTTGSGFNPCSASAPSAVYGHTGYTGTCGWVDPIHQFVFVFLSNRTYPSDGVNKLAKMRIRPKIQDLLYD